MSAEELKLDFNPETLREKYRSERDKRRRDDGNAQYQQVAGDFTHYVDDPYIDKIIIRDPLEDEVDVIIVGGGFGGLITGARLREAGVKNIRIIEKGGDFGGTWYWNRYPGAACDVESYIYLPLCEELGFVPKEKYTHAPEILQHSRNIGEKYDLYGNACFQTEVTGMQWDESAAQWQVSTNRGDRMKAKFVVMSNGPLNRPKLPGITGIDDYQGHTFHTSRWDYNYTGGGPEGDLINLANKRVGIIGTGATAVQCVPHLGAAAKELFVFQRTPSSIDVRDNRQTDPEWAKNLKPGWQKERMENFNTLTSGGIANEDMVNDGWTEIIRNLASMVNFKTDNVDWAEVPKLMEIADFQKMEQIRARAQQVVDDPSTAESLKPYYRQFCKRPCFHDDYLPTFNRDSVHLVDTQGRGVEAITAKGVIANGVEHELDCIIFATGFEVGTEYTRRAGYDLIGKGGLKLSEKWSEGIKTLHGLHTQGFPNLFVISNAQSGFTVNFPHAMDEQAQHICYIVKECAAGNINTVEATAAAENAWVEEIIGMSRFNQEFLESCTPGYYNNEGEPNPKSIQNGSYGAGPDAFFAKIKRWRDEGTMEGLDLG
ncbi:putative monooxygenase [marine gamma proteobacterium HTCC2143]|jgi:cation diffusion facilitator CzcD-associated flavoprotein CzcO|uniref:Putative monooxygenase n=1 Tax=marine gamma proteobacterium HTCC2143 TaxID=247633 RepID=A0YGA4_9GAMM|nr:putative monooxygenase [marine gamma proteobacterium HTCC2143]